MLIQNHQLTQQQLFDLDHLCNECKSEDGNIVAIYKHYLSQNRPRLCNMLYYHKKKLIGFLSTFFFYKDACEITVMVKPNFRGQGIASHMIKKILPLIREENLGSLIFSTPHDLNNDWLSKHGFQYLHSEYQMQLLQHYPLSIANQSLVIRLATQSDLAIICAIDHACFESPQPDLPIHIQNLLYDPNYKIFIAELAGVPIGKAHLDIKPETTRLTDIAILPKFQKRGFGSNMLTYCINYSLMANQSNLSLNVETKNQQALKIYTRLGFKVNNAYDFWTIPIEVLRLAKH